MYDDDDEHSGYINNNTRMYVHRRVVDKTSVAAPCEVCSGGGGGGGHSFIASADAMTRTVGCSCRYTRTMIVMYF